MLFRVTYLGLLCLILLLSALAQVATGSVEAPFVDVPFDVTNIPEPVPPPQEVRFFLDWIRFMNSGLTSKVFQF